MSSAAVRFSSWLCDKYHICGHASRSRRHWSPRLAMDLVAAADAFTLVLGAILSVVAGALFDLLPAIPVSAPLLPGALAALFFVTVAHMAGRYGVENTGRLPVLPAGELAVMASVIAIMAGLGAAFNAPQRGLVHWGLLWFAISAPLFSLSRLALSCTFSAMSAAGRFRRNIAVYGAGYIARLVYDHVMGQKGATRFCGIYEDRQQEGRINRHGLEISGTLEDLIAQGRRGEIDEIIIALPQHADKRILEIAARLDQLPLQIHVCTHVSTLELSKNRKNPEIAMLGPVGILNIKKKPISEREQVAKQLLDYTLALAGLILASPLFLIIAAAIRLESQGPVFFRQNRHGLNHRQIEVLKFRTMTVQENGARVVQATRNDPRVTRVGRLLRKTSLDELPQLINVLRGEMSLVGPRPHALVHNEHYGALLEKYANRHQVKPGITGWAQIHGFRGETREVEDMRKRVQFDLQYIRNWSLWLDLKIIVLTPFALLKMKNAY